MPPPRSRSRGGSQHTTPLPGWLPLTRRRRHCLGSWLCRPGRAHASASSWPFAGRTPGSWGPPIRGLGNPHCPDRRARPGPTPQASHFPGETNRNFHGFYLIFEMGIPATRSMLILTVQGHLACHIFKVMRLSLGWKRQRAMGPSSSVVLRGFCLPQWKCLELVFRFLQKLCSWKHVKQTTIFPPPSWCWAQSSGSAGCGGGLHR